MSYSPTTDAAADPEDTLVPAMPVRERLTDVSVRIVPDVVTVALHTEGTASTSGNRVLPSPYHRVQPKPDARVSVSWTPRAGSVGDRRPRLIRLTIETKPGVGWDSKWVRWVHAIRRPSYLRGGEAVGAQDVLSDDGSSLTLLLLPEDEPRGVTLEFHPLMAAGIRTGDYPFTIVAEDVESPRFVDTVDSVLRLIHPQTQLLDYLPSLFREAMEDEMRMEEPLSADSIGRYAAPPFFVRYLRGFEDLQEPVRDAIGALYTLFGTETAPADFVPWLAQWVALTLDENWPELRRRRLIREAVSLYRWRGTRRGLARYLEVYTGVTPEINDQPFVGMRIGPSAVLGNPSTRLGNVLPHTFVVSIAHPAPSELSEATVRTIIDAQKPAHTTYALRILPKQV